MKGLTKDFRLAKKNKTTGLATRSSSPKDKGDAPEGQQRRGLYDTNAARGYL